MSKTADVKTYEDYILQSQITIENLIRKYGAPPEAKVPIRIVIIDGLIRIEL